jgi:hypothetical protein
MSVVVVATIEHHEGADQDAETAKVDMLWLDLEKNIGLYLYRRYIVDINGAIMKTSCVDHVFFAVIVALSHFLPPVLRSVRRSIV